MPRTEKMNCCTYGAAMCLPNSVHIKMRDWRTVSRRFRVSSQPTVGQHHWYDCKLIDSDGLTHGCSSRVKMTQPLQIVLVNSLVNNWTLLGRRLSCIRHACT